MRTLLVLSLVCFILAISSATSYAGKIGNLNINATDGANVKVHSSNKSTIEKTTIKKDGKSTVIIDGKEVNCNDATVKDGICKPDSY